MPVYEMVPATLEHVLYLAPRLRKADVEEMWAAHHVEPEMGLIISLEVSRDTGYTGLVDGKPVCIYGVAAPSLLVDAGRPWMVGSDSIPKHSLRFLRESRKVVKAWREQHPRMFNYVDARHDEAIKWLKWLGFSIHEAAPYGAGQLPFHRFTMGDA